MLVACLACLDPNSDFDGPVSTTGTEASVSETSADTSCEDDSLETDGMSEGAIDVGSNALRITEAGGSDMFNMFVFDVGAGELHYSVDVELEICAYVVCEGGVPADVPLCIEPATSASLEDGSHGCCARNVLDLTYDCPAAMGAKIHVRVNDAPADCTFYSLEVATSLP